MKSAVNVINHSVSKLYFSVILWNYILINIQNILKSDIAGSPQMCFTYSMYFHARALEICNEDVFFERVYQRPVTCMNGSD